MYNLQSNFKSRCPKTYSVTILYPILCKASDNYNSDSTVPQSRRSSSQNRCSAEYYDKNHFQEKTCDEVCFEILPRVFSKKCSKIFRKTFLRPSLDFCFRYMSLNMIENGGLMKTIMKYLS